ncbi:MAG: hypothetical protein ACR2NU_11060 [Aeoliella sp.]
MRAIFFLIVMLLAVGSIAASLDAPPAQFEVSATETIEFEWVRTSEGWQRPAAWGPVAVIPPPIHPGVVACFICFASLWVLVAWPTKPGGTDLR